MTRPILTITASMLLLSNLGAADPLPVSIRTGEKFHGPRDAQSPPLPGELETDPRSAGRHLQERPGVFHQRESSIVKELSGESRVRGIVLGQQKTGPIRKLVPSSLDNQIAPVILASTTDLKGEASAPQAVTGRPVQANPKKPAVRKRANSGEPPPVPSTPVRWEKGKKRVLLIGGGSSHDFLRFFGKEDSAILTGAGFTVHYTEDGPQAAKLLAEAEVAVISVNRKGFDTAPYRKALMDRVAAGKGVIMLHPGTWYGYPNWPELNAKIVGGGARGHDRLGPFKIEVTAKDHPIMKGIPASFELVDELYYVNAEGTPEGTSPITVLARTSPSQKYGKPHPSVWTVQHPKARLVGIAPGHDERAHGHPAFQRLLSNAVQWAGGD